MPRLHEHTHFWQHTHTHNKNRTHTHMLTPEGMSYLKLTSQNEHIQAGIYKRGHTLGLVGRRHRVQRVRHEWRSGHRLPLAHSGCILHTGTGALTHNVSHACFLAIKPSSSQCTPWLGGWTVFSALREPLTTTPYNPLARSCLQRDTLA